MQHNAPDVPWHQELTDGLARAQAALARAEAAAARLEARHRALRSAARDTVAGLDRLLASATDSRDAERHG